MRQISEALLAHSIVLATASAALFAVIGVIIGWHKHRTTYAMYFAVLGGLCAFGLMSVFKFGDKLGL